MEETNNMEETEKKKERKYYILGIIAVLLTLLSAVGFASASTPIYSDSAEYKAVMHTYDIPDSLVGYVTVDTRGTSANENSFVIFNYIDGSSSKTEGQVVDYLSWSTKTFVNPNPNSVVASVDASGGTHTSFRNFNAYTGSPFSPLNSVGGGSTVNITTNNTNTTCGNGIKEGNESCDAGVDNGKVCTPAYGSSCTYCTASCQTQTVMGGYCGDGILQSAFEACDDGNSVNWGDSCTNECKKPFSVNVEEFPPQVWECDHRIVYDDGTEPGRISQDGQTLVERINDYAFEGEQIQWKVLVMDKNGIDKVPEVYVTVNGNIQANCQRLTEDPKTVENDCNARLLEEQITEFNPLTMAYYLCTLTVETPDSQDMYGEQDITVEAMDLDGLLGDMAETEHWFLNPTIQLSVDGDLSLDNVRPGTSAYSSRVLVGNAAEDGSGVLLDMFISGTDFYDSSSSGAKCPTTNQLALENFRYYASSGGYSTHTDPRADSEGYVPIQYGTGFNDPKPFYNRNEIIQTNQLSPYYISNTLSPGAEMSLIFRLNLPEPCNGNFDTGSILFWGEAI